MPSGRESEKPKVVEYLYTEYEAGNVPDGIVTSNHILAAIDATGADLSKSNPANFLKDIIRNDNANANWPDPLKLKRITARQRYGARRVFQFVAYQEGQTEPFPDRLFPGLRTQVHPVQAASISFVARRLGRTEETWLTQIAVNLRLIEMQLSIFSPLRGRVRDVTHLQMGMKTQPEIDAVFLASYGEDEMLQSSTSLYMLISCEAKQIAQRILEDQIREQVAKAMSITTAIETPKIDAVKPMAVKVVEYDFGGIMEKAVYVVEFAHITREVFNSEWASSRDDEEKLYAMPLESVSDTVYRVMPRIGGLNS